MKYSTLQADELQNFAHITAEIRFEDNNERFPLFEFLDVANTNELTGEHFDGPLGCNFLSYIRAPLVQAALIAIMNIFQQIYRPEIYCSTLPVDSVYIPNSENKCFDPTSFTYDREERGQVLSINQALFVKENFLDKKQLQSISWL